MWIICDDYEIIREIGRGSYSQVLKARDKRTGILRAIKVMNLEGMSPKEYINLDRELHILTSLRGTSPNVVELIDVREDPANSYKYLIFELCEGGDLLAAIRNNNKKHGGGLPETVCCRLFAQMIMGMEQLWRRNFIHRDLKPANLLLSESNPATATLKVADFGFVRKVSPGTMAVTLCGSPLYMAPEVVKHGSTYDYKADIWSLGVILFEMLTGSAAFYSPTGIMELPRVVAEQTPKLEWRARNAGVSKSAIDLLRITLSVDPIQRVSRTGLLRHRFVANGFDLLGSTLPALSTPTLSMPTLPQFPSPVMGAVTTGEPPSESSTVFQSMSLGPDSDDSTADSPGSGAMSSFAASPATTHRTVHEATDDEPEAMEPPRTKETRSESTATLTQARPATISTTRSRPLIEIAPLVITESQSTLQKRFAYANSNEILPEKLWADLPSDTFESLIQQFRRGMQAQLTECDIPVNERHTFKPWTSPKYGLDDNDVTLPVLMELLGRVVSVVRHNLRYSFIRATEAPDAIAPSRVLLTALLLCDSMVRCVRPSQPYALMVAEGALNIGVRIGVFAKSVPAVTQPLPPSFVSETLPALMYLYQTVGVIVTKTVPSRIEPLPEVPLTACLPTGPFLLATPKANRLVMARNAKGGAELREVDAVEAITSISVAISNLSNKYLGSIDPIEILCIFSAIEKYLQDLATFTLSGDAKSARVSALRAHLLATWCKSITGDRLDQLDSVISAVAPLAGL
ncbi:Protein kinase domain [Carpediemonas membranifera]|uniref:Protein kinase domain n=1 Tax=Carpediemonas membranifera TaxID=201153 RepID=A0A8J6B9C9_9EUKA|nr:Protein kinase domain [Carpediemonas membranifera]|eukprot:KAG9395492.1 Protein kinase domain [Carpediemonas membranifera]